MGWGKRVVGQGVRRMPIQHSTIQQKEGAGGTWLAGWLAGWQAGSREESVEAHKAPGAAALDGVGEAHRHGQQGSHLQRHAVDVAVGMAAV